MSSRPVPGRNLVRHLPLALILLVPLLLVGKTLGSGKVLFGIDMTQGSYHIRDLVGRSLSEGRIPVWDSHAMCGFPLLAALQAGVFYPPTWASLVLSGGAMWGFLVFLHMALAGLFAYAWLRRGYAVGKPAALAGAAVFMLSGYFTVHAFAGHVSQVSAYPWLAAILWRTERYLAGPSLRRGVLLSGSMALLFLTGFPHFVLVAGLLAGARILFAMLGERRGEAGRWKSAAGAAVALGWGLVLAAPQLLPALELIPHAQRVSANRYDFTTSFSFPPENLLLFLTPGFFGDVVNTPYWGRSVMWEACAFVGIAALALAVVGLTGRHRSRWFWAGAALVGVLIALGKHGAFFEIFHALVPGAGFFRVPGRYLSILVVSLAPLVALGVERLVAEEEARRTVRGLAVATAVLAALLVTLRIVGGVSGAQSDLWYAVVVYTNVGDGFSPPMPVPRKGPEMVKIFEGAMATLTWASLITAAIAAVFVAVALGKMKARVAGWTLAGVGALELLIFAGPYFRSQEVAPLYWHPSLVEFARKHPAHPFRIASAHETHVLDVGRCQAAGIDHLGGYEALALARYAELMNALSGFSPGAVTVSAPASGPHPVYDMLGGRLWMLTGKERVRPAWKEVGRAGNSRIYESPEALGRAFVVPRAEMVAGNEERLLRLVRGPLDPRVEVLVEKDPGPGGTGAPGTVKVAAYAPGEYALEVDAPGGGFLVLTEAYYPGWRAEVDGKETEILRANHFVQAIRIAPGPHQVTWRYRSTHLRTGFLLFAIGIAVPAGWALRNRFRRPTSEAPSR